jgi:glycosyltransferase involved in cell wall biosynthesis
MKKLSVVVPVYNEEKNIETFLIRTTSVLNKIFIDKSYEIIFCLDPCSDNTENIIKNYCSINPNVALIKMSRRFGQPACTMAGIKNCNGDYCIIIDADLQDPPELIEELYNKCVNNYDVVYAVRERREGINWFYKIITFFGYYIIKKFSDISIPRNTGDFRIVSRRVIKHLSSLKESHGFLRGLVSFVGFKQGSILYTRQKRFHGDSNYNKYFGSIKIALNGLIVYSNFVINFLFFLGISIFILVLVLVLLLIYNNLFGSKIYPVGLSSIILLVMLMGSLQLLSLSFVGQYISRIYDEVKERPQFIIDEKINL